MKKILMILLVALFLGNCSTYYQYDNTNRIVSKKTTLSPIGTLIFTSIVYTATDYHLANNRYYYSHGNYGNRIYSRNYYTGNIVRSIYGQQYCDHTCTMTGLGHIHRYYTPRQPRAIDFVRSRRERDRVNNITARYCHQTGHHYRGCPHRY